MLISPNRYVAVHYKSLGSDHTGVFVCTTQKILSRFLLLSLPRSNFHRSRFLSFRNVLRLVEFFLGLLRMYVCKIIATLVSLKKKKSRPSYSFTFEHLP